MPCQPPAPATAAQGPAELGRERYLHPAVASPRGLSCSQVGVALRDDAVKEWEGRDMWAQLIKLRLKPGKDLAVAVPPLRAPSPPRPAPRPECVPQTPQ